MVKANDKQEGGSHYKAVYQHWDYISDTAMPYMLAQLTRYVTRWRKKNGLEDIKKAIHYAQKQRELHLQNKKRFERLVNDFCQENNLGEEEELVFNFVNNYMLGDLKTLDAIENVLQSMLFKLQQVRDDAPPDVNYDDKPDEWRR